MTAITQGEKQSESLCLYYTFVVANSKMYVVEMSGNGKYW